MPARKTIELLSGGKRLAVSIASNEPEAVFIFTDNETETEFKVSINEFKEFLSLLNQLKSSLVTPINHVPAPRRPESFKSKENLTFIETGLPE